MQIGFDIDLSADDRTALAAALGCAPGELPDVLSRHALAALHEHVECYLGRRASARGNDILEHRLSLLARFAFQNSLPGDTVVSRLFQTTPTASRTLIRNTLAKYRTQLAVASTMAARAVLEAATWPGGNGNDYHAKDPPRNVVELLNERLLVEDATLRQVARVPDSAGLYGINKHSYDRLCVAFGATAVVRP